MIGEIKAIDRRRDLLRVGDRLKVHIDETRYNGEDD